MQIPVFLPTIRPFQLEAMKDKRKNKVLVIHRRAGKTALAVNKLIHAAMTDKGKVYLYVCPKQIQAKDVIWKDPEMMNKYLPNEIVQRKNEVELTIWLKNGSQIYVRGGDDPDRLRGLNPYGVILDEYAQMKQEVYDEVLKPVLLANGGWIWFMGTPKGKNDFYRKYKIANDNPAQWHVIHLKASESKLLPPGALEEARKTSTEAIFRQEFESEFQESEGIIFRRIRENISGMLEESRAGRSYQMGVDLARLQDWTVVTVMDKHSHHLVYFDRFNQIDWNFQKARIEAISRRYNMAPIIVDSTGVGDPIAEDLRRMGLIVSDVKFTNTSKRRLVENLALLIEQNKITYPDIKILISELEEYSYEMLPSGVVKYSAPQGLYDDCVMSFCLAVWQLGEKLATKNDKRLNYGFKWRLNQPKGYARQIFRQ
jgi:phage FluMu gp28-like protein